MSDTNNIKVPDICDAETAGGHNNSPLTQPNETTLPESNAMGIVQESTKDALLNLTRLSSNPGFKLKK
jgi:hypothetical protein